VDGDDRDVGRHRPDGVPRLPAIAELGWSPWTTHDVTAFDTRLGAQGPRWKLLGINYYKSPQVTWPIGS